jgi:hypothetical protein
MTERTFSTNRFDIGPVVSRLRVLFAGTFTGIMGGMGAFLFINSEFMPLGLGENWGLLVISVAGVYTHLISADLTESISIAMIAYFVGLGVHVGASIAPLWILSYPPLARDLLLPSMVGQAIAGNFFGYLTMFSGSYFAAVAFDGYYER